MEIQKIEKTIKVMKQHKCEEISLYGEEYNLAISSLEKQIPKKPFVYKGYEGKCVCGAVFLDRSTKYCGNCGQAIDWSDTD